MGDFLAAPFLLIMNVAIYIAAFLNGKAYFIVEANPEDVEDDNEY